MAAPYGSSADPRAISREAMARHALYPDRPARQRTLIRALLEGGTIPAQHAIVRNVSEEGLCITAMGMAPRRGDRVRITLPGAILLDGDICWSEGTACGVKLTSALDIRQLAIATQRRNAGIAGAIDWRVGESLRLPRPESDPRLRRI